MRDSVHVWRYVVDDMCPCVEYDYQPEWPEGGPFPRYEEYGVPHQRGAEVVVYTGLTWELTGGRQRLAILPGPDYHPKFAAENLRQEPVLVDWQYGVDPRRETEHGFVNLAAWRERLFQLQSFRFDLHELVKSADRDKARLFELHSFRDLAQALKSTPGDVSAAVTVLGVLPAPERTERLRQVLCAAQVPTLAQVLEPGEVFVHITISLDMGYMDALTIASLENLRPQLETLCSAFRERILAFEKRGPVDISTYLAALGTLAGVG